MFGERVREVRSARGLTQAQLAELAEVSRQLVGAVEAGRHLPRVDAAARLAAALSTSVEALFARTTNEAVGVLEAPAEGSLVRLARVGERLVCVPAAGSGEGWASADAQIQAGTVALFDVERPAVVIAGCDPVVGLVARLLETTHGPRVIPVATSSATARWVLRAGRSHAVTVHGPDAPGSEAPAATRRWHIARWRVGLAAPADTAEGWVADALAGRVPVAHREPGAGSQAAFERARTVKDAATAPVRGPRVAGHAEAAWRAVTDRMVAVTIEPAALANGLVFHPLETHSSELWVAAEHADNPLLHAFMDELVGDRVHRRLTAIGGYDLTDNGTELVA